MSNSVTVAVEKSALLLAKDFAWEKIGLLGAVCSLVLLDGVNGAMCSVLGRYLAGGFAVTSDQITWGAICYYVSKLYALLLAARVQERFGQRRAFLGASMVLVAATAAGALVPNYPALLALLLLQGGAGGLMLALGQGTLLSVFPRREQPLVQAAYALTAVMFPATIVPAFLGGFAYYLHWQDPYICITPFGLLGWGWLLWRQKLLDDSVQSSPVPVIRIVLLVTFLFAVVYVLQQGNRLAWFESPKIFWALLLAAVCVLGIAFKETSGGPTYLRYEAFRYANFTFGICGSLLAGAALNGSAFAISGFASGVLVYPVSDSGLVQLSGTVFACISFPVVGLLLRFVKIPAVLVTLFGLLLFGLAMWNLGDAPSNLNFEGFASWLTLRGFALGCQFIPITLLTLTCLPAKDNVAAAGFFNFGRTMGTLCGTAWMQTLHEHLTDRNQTIFGQALSLANPNAMNYAQSAQQALSSLGAPPAQTPPAATALVLHEASRQWSSIAFNGCFESLAMLFIFSLPVLVSIRILVTRFLKPPACN